MSWAEANICYLRAMQLPDRSSNEAQRLLVSAVAFLETALNKATTNMRIMYLLASSLFHLSVICHTKSLEGGNKESAQTEEESESEAGVSDSGGNNEAAVGAGVAGSSSSSRGGGRSVSPSPRRSTDTLHGLAATADDSSEALKYLSKVSRMSRWAVPPLFSIVSSVFV